MIVLAALALLVLAAGLVWLGATVGRAHLRATLREAARHAPGDVIASLTIEKLMRQTDGRP